MILIGILGSSFLINFLYTAIAPFYPLIATEKGVPLWLVGQIFVLMPVVTFLTTPFISKQVKVIGYKASMALSLFFTVIPTQALAFILIGIAPLTSTYPFLILSFGSRIFGGVAFALGYTSEFSLVMHIYPDNSERYISLSEFSAGLGLLGGPAILSPLIRFFSFSSLMLGIASVVIVFIPIIIITIPNGKTVPESKGSSLSFLKNKNILLDFLLNTYGNLSYLYIDPLLQLYMLDKGYSQELVGLGFVLQTGSYMLTCLFFILFPTKLRHFTVILFSAFSGFMGLFLIGSIEYLIEQTLTGIYVGLILIGTANAIVFVNVIPSMLNETKTYLKVEEEEDSGTEPLIAGLFGMSISLGEVSGQEFGTCVSYFFDIRLSSTILVGLGVGLFISYFFFRTRSKV